MDNSISSTLAVCLQRFNRVLDSDLLASHESNVPISLWQDELGRLRVWAANIGAHRKDQSSLDYRLRDASHIRDQTIQLLRNLDGWFNDLEDVLAEPSPGDEAEEDDEASDDDFEDISEVQQIYQGLVETITCLYQLSMAIRRPTQHDRILGTQKEDARIFEPFDREHVANKFPNAETALVDRLGAAISRRRAALRYRERHHKKMAHGVSNNETDHAPTEFSATVATELSNVNLAIQDNSSDAGRSKTSYAPTLFNSTDRLIIPFPKNVVFDDPVECPYCYYIIVIRDRKAWARHVFQDISPYICPFEQCPTANRLYWRQREWYSHIQSQHSHMLETGSLSCPLCKNALQPSLIKRHLAGHMEELALFAVPRAEESGGEGSDINQDLSVDSRGSANGDLGSSIDDGTKNARSDIDQTMSRESTHGSGTEAGEGPSGLALRVPESSHTLSNHTVMHGILDFAGTQQYDLQSQSISDGMEMLQQPDTLADLVTRGQKPIFSSYGPFGMPAEPPVVEEKKPEGPTGSRVSWGKDQGHEYEVPSTSSERISLALDEGRYQSLGEEPRDTPIGYTHITQSAIEAEDTEFAATVAAAAQAAGFDPSLITEDRIFHTRTSPLGSDTRERSISP
jgi:uncharacterized C2H2 Zn-finger protein